MEDVKSFTLASGKVVEMGRMTVDQFIRAQDLIGQATNDIKIGFVLAVASIQKIDGQPVLPLSNPIAFDGVAKRFNMQDGWEIVNAYAEMNPAPVGDELKNESSAQP